MATQELRWVTDDGKAFVTEEEAERHEKTVEFRRWADEYFRGGEYSASMIADAVLENWAIGRRL